LLDDIDIGKTLKKERESCSLKLNNTMHRLNNTMSNTKQQTINWQGNSIVPMKGRIIFSNAFVKSKSTRLCKAYK
jgi:hypothetical protein